MFIQNPLSSQQQNKARFKSIVLFGLVIAALPSISVAELQWLDEASLSKVVGKAGLTIDIESKLTIAEVEYVDAGSMYWKDYSLSGIGGGLMDNVRATVDSSNGTETLGIGFSDVAKLASMGYLDATDADVAWALTEYNDGAGGFGKKQNDGDLVIHVTSQDFGIDFTVPADPADQVTNMEAMKNAVDFHIQQGDFGIRSSDKLTETSITRNLSIEGYLGYLDIILRNNGDGLYSTASTPGDLGKPENIEIGNSYIELDLKFRIEDLDVDNTNTVDPILGFVTSNGFTLRDMRIHNERGTDTLGSFGYASFQSKIASASGILASIDNFSAANPYVDGQAIYDINIRMDWDLPHVSFGDTGQSIGEIFFTDLVFSNTSLVISAH
ncbi:MAG: hypothetical protein ACI9T7_002337 [Oleiphilaceae bacterium]|jgi:hypothetical protein